mmetsp:Transcript_38900/g.94048  ORF Transcript_38900/g.94048 Transcript_38900/m.94048 type:complete len:119 (+) Transcript_38900:2278-2634(+)
MPRADTGSRNLDSFLRSNEEGPKTIVVGNGIRNARNLAENEKEKQLSNGYSATISSPDGAGGSASVVVHKTNDLYKFACDNNMKILSIVRTKLRKHSLSAPSPQEPAVKKPRIDREEA